MAKYVPALNHKTVQGVLSGKRNGGILREIGVNTSDNSWNYEINIAKKFFKKKPLVKKFAIKLLSFGWTPKTQAEFKNFCDLPKDVQIIELNKKSESVDKDGVNKFNRHLIKAMG